MVQDHSFYFIGAGNGSRTRILTLARLHNSRYTIPAVFSLCFLDTRILWKNFTFSQKQHSHSNRKAGNSSTGGMKYTDIS